MDGRYVMMLSPEEYEPARNCHVSDHTFSVYVRRKSYKKRRRAIWQVQLGKPGICDEAESSGQNFARGEPAAETECYGQ